MKHLIRLLVMATIILLSGCATINEAKNIPPPQNFMEAIIISQGQLSAIRDTTSFIVRARGEDCINRQFTDLCTAAKRIDKETRRYRNRLDQIRDVYFATSLNLADCKLVYGDVELPCEDGFDQVTAGIIDLRKLIANEGVP